MIKKQKVSDPSRRASLLALLRKLRWDDAVEESPVISGGIRFLWDFFLPAHSRYKESGYRKALDLWKRSGFREDNPESLAIRGRIWRLLGQEDAAEADFSKSLRLNPRCAAALAFRAEAYLVQDPRRAVKDIVWSLNVSPGPACYHLWLGYAYWLSGRYEKAQETLQVSSAAGLVCSKILQGIFWQKMGCLERAETALDGAIQARPDQSGIYSLRASVRHQAGHEAKAFDDCRRAILLHPENLDAFISVLNPRYGMNLPIEIDRDRALLLSSVERFLKKQPNIAWPYAVRAELLNRGISGTQRRQSIRSLQEARRIDPHDPWIRAFLGRVLVSFSSGRGHIEQGLRELSRAVELAPRIGWIRAWRAEGFRRIGMPRHALKDLNEAIRRKPFYPLAYAWRGILHEEMGNLLAAKKDLDRCVGMLQREGFYRRWILLKQKIIKKISRRTLV